MLTEEITFICSSNQDALRVATLFRSNGAECIVEEANDLISTSVWKIKLLASEQSCNAILNLCDTELENDENSIETKLFYTFATVIISEILNNIKNNDG